MFGRSCWLLVGALWLSSAWLLLTQGLSSSDPSTRTVKTSLHGNCLLRRCCRLNLYVEVLSLSTLQNVNVLGDKVFQEVCACVLSCFSHVQLFVTLDWSPSGSAVHGILWARILEWVAMPFSRGSSQPRD